MKLYLFVLLVVALLYVANAAEDLAPKFKLREKLRTKLGEGKGKKVLGGFAKRLRERRQNSEVEESSRRFGSIFRKIKERRAEEDLGRFRMRRVVRSVVKYGKPILKSYLQSQVGGDDDQFSRRFKRRVRRSIKRIGGEVLDHGKEYLKEKALEKLSEEDEGKIGDFLKKEGKEFLKDYLRQKLSEDDEGKRWKRFTKKAGKAAKKYGKELLEHGKVYIKEKLLEKLSEDDEGKVGDILKREGKEFLKDFLRKKLSEDDEGKKWKKFTKKAGKAAKKYGKKYGRELLEHGKEYLREKLSEQDEGRFGDFVKDQGKAYARDYLIRKLSDDDFEAEPEDWEALGKLALKYGKDFLISFLQKKLSEDDMLTIRDGVVGDIVINQNGQWTRPGRNPRFKQRFAEDDLEVVYDHPLFGGRLPYNPRRY